MTNSFKATPGQPSLTTAQLEMVQRVWRIAGWPPVTGYGILVLAAVVAANAPLAATLTTVDSDDANAVAAAVEALRCSRGRM